MPVRARTRSQSLALVSSGATRASSGAARAGSDAARSGSGCHQSRPGGRREENTRVAQVAFLDIDLEKFVGRSVPGFGSIVDLLFDQFLTDVCLAFVGRVLIDF